MPRKKTRAAQGAGTIRQRKDGRWEARVTIGRDPGTGKQIQRSIYGATQAEVRKKLTQTISAVDTGTYIEPCKMTLNQWLDIWTRDYIGDVKPSTALLYQNQIRLYIRPALGAIKLEALNPHDIQGLYNRLKSGNEGKSGVSAKTVRNVHGVLHKALQQAVELGYLRTNPSDTCKLPKKELREMHPLNEDQIPLFLKAIQGHRHEILYRVALFTGMREGEILGLTWTAVDFQRGTITIKQQLTKEKKKGGKYYIAPPKNGKPRTITPAPTVMKLLQTQRRRQMEQRLQMGAQWQDSGMVFTNENGGYLSYRTVFDCFKRIVGKIGAPDTRFHDLRHSYVVLAIKSGDDFKTISENLGHATVAFTMQVYAHVTDQMRQDSANRMEAFINAIGNA